MPTVLLDPPPGGHPMHLESAEFYSVDKCKKIAFLGLGENLGYED
jgi:hypothetical protein